MANYASAIVKQAQSWLGCKESDGSHKKIIDVYNSHKPLARGYKMSYKDPWCATFVSAVSIKCGTTNILPTECECNCFIQLFKNLNSWVENDAYTPKAGDVIFYDWDDGGRGDNKGSSDHVGIVEKVSGSTITIIEGNMSHAVKRRVIGVNDRYIRGYGVPKYDTMIEKTTPEEDGVDYVEGFTRFLLTREANLGDKNVSVELASENNRPLVQDIELLIEANGTLIQPIVEEGIQWTTERVGSPSTLKFTVVKDELLGDIGFQEGNAVRLKVNGEEVFYGFVFQKKRSKGQTIDVTCYDQLRYLKNKDTYVYEKKTASQVIQMIAKDFKLNLGTIEPTEYIIPSRVEDNQGLFDIIQNALDLELQNKGELFCLYDKFGKLTLQNIASMKLDLMIDAEAMEDFSYTSSIDSETYNQIKLTYDNDETGTREVYMVKDSSNSNAWGVLQYTEKLQEGENGKAKADALLELYNKKTRTLKLDNCFGDIRCRAGSMPIVRLHIGDMMLSNYMIVEKATHTFKNNQHTMSLNVRGGEFVV